MSTIKIKTNTKTHTCLSINRCFGNHFIFSIIKSIKCHADFLTFFNLVFIEKFHSISSFFYLIWLFLVLRLKKLNENVPNPYEIEQMKSIDENNKGNDLFHLSVADTHHDWMNWMQFVLPLPLALCCRGMWSWSVSASDTNVNLTSFLSGSHQIATDLIFIAIFVSIFISFLFLLLRLGMLLLVSSFSFTLATSTSSATVYANQGNGVYTNLSEADYSRIRCAHAQNIDTIILLEIFQHCVFDLESVHFMWIWLQTVEREMVFFAQLSNEVSFVLSLCACE